MKTDLSSLRHAIPRDLGSFTEFYERRRINLEVMTSDQYVMAYENYRNRFTQAISKTESGHDDHTKGIIRTVVRAAIGNIQDSANYLGDCYDVELPESLAWCQLLLPASPITSFAWMATDDLAGMLVEKFTTSGYSDYRTWSVHTVWRITGDKWQLTFGEPTRPSPYFDMTLRDRIMLYTSYQDEYLRNKFKISEINNVNLIGDADDFLGDVALLSLL